MKADETRTCLVCGTRFPTTKEFCPVCMLREALDEEIKPAKASLKGVGLSRRGRRPPYRFEHYDLVIGKDGKPVELGRGAMGVTYKGFDVGLRCPVTLKVISEQYFGDESARLRFLREARAAAKVRHSNVASVLHLGRTGKRYFYAMEFVEGKTLERLIRHSGRVEVKLALEIATQVAAGLAAVHRQKLVHRDIKPSNIMVNLEEGGAVTTKIIDLGLAKTVSEQASQSAISTPGGFVGTPEFASPEQFAGIGVDIRSDLYSLGVVLWEMVVGRAPFQGLPAEVMYQHQHAPLPLEQLEDAPQPVIVLLEMLLEKDPVRRFQNPADLLKGMSLITDAIAARRRINRQILQKMLARDSRALVHKPPARLGPKKISVARLPVTGSDLFGRDQDIAFLDAAWTNEQVNIVTIVAWAGVGKSTLVNYWLGQMAAEDYRSAELIFGWSFYRQGTTGKSSSADEFVDVALAWFGDPDPQIGTAWEKGERLAKLISHRRTLLVLDGLEPLQNPPGPQEGHLREPSLQALLRELAAFNRGLCVITTRTPVADVADHERTSARRHDLEQLSGDAGAKLLRALDVKGPDAELQSASEEFSGHCLALTPLGSFLTDAYNGEIRCRKEVSARLAHDVRQGLHARKVMESYQSWLGEGPELSVLLMLGLFDRPADQRAVDALLKPPAVRGLTESLTDLNPTEWRTVLARLRRARLLAREDPDNPGHLDAHPLVREYFGEQLRSQRNEAWKECNKRLFDHYRTLAPQLPGNFREMEPLFLAVICGCNAGLFHEALHEVYIPRIQRGNASFAANILGARGALLSALAHFFEHCRWDSPVEMGVDRHSLTSEDQLLILIQAALFLTATRESTPDIRICYQRAEALCHSLNRPRSLYVALKGQWRYSLITDKLSTTMSIAKRVCSLAQEQNDSTLMMGAYTSLAATLYYVGDFQTAQQYAMCGLQIWRSGAASSRFEEVDSQPVACLCHQAIFEWHFGEIVSSQATMAESISLARELNDMHGLGVALYCSTVLAYLERNAAEVEHLSSDLIQLSARHSFAHFLTTRFLLRGWVRSVSGNIMEGIALIEEAIEDYRAIGSTLLLPFFLALKAEALHIAGRTSEALAAIREAEALVERIEGRWLSAELHRLRGVLLAAVGADEAQIEASFRAAIRTAKEQKSVSLAKRAEASYAEYRSQKTRALGGRGVRPEKVSVARLPVTGSDVFGREEDIALLDDAWANQRVNIVTIVAWAGVGKSTLVNYWLGQMAAEDYRSAELVFGWTFYRQGTTGKSSSADEFVDVALAWFGDPDSRIGTAWEKGERLAKLISHRRTLLVLDGLEPLQNPPGPQEGRLREPSLQALLRELAAFNRGLCVITTRAPVADVAHHERTSARRLDLEQLPRDAGAKLLGALGVSGSEAELRNASDEFSGHCLALTLLGSYLSDACSGDIRRRKEVSARLASDTRQGAHARKVMESYQTWFGEGPELSVLRVLGLFDRPADEKALEALLKLPTIPGLTDSVTDLSPTEWYGTLARLRRAKLIARQDSHNPGHLDTHPLVREFFGQQLRNERPEAWKQGNRRLYYYYKALAPQLPENFREMEPLFLAAICGCNAGLFRDVLHGIYIPRIQRGDSSFAANVLGARGALLSVLAHFFGNLNWDSPLEPGVEDQHLSPEDQLFILAQAALYLTTTRGMGVSEARMCYERVESLCRSVNSPRLRYSAMIGKWRYSLTNEKLTDAMQIAKRVHLMAEQQKDPALLTGAYNALACTAYSQGDFEAALEFATRGVQIWRSGGMANPLEEVDSPVVSCLFHKALSQWHLGEITFCHATMAEAESLAKELNDMPALANAVFNSGVLSHFERNDSEAARFASDVIELSTRYNFAFWLTIGSILLGWARSALGKTAEGISTIENGIRDYRANGQALGMPHFLGLKAEALYLADRTCEALETIEEAKAFAQRTGAHFWYAELHRLRGVFLAALGADEIQIEASFCTAIKIAREQKSVSLEKRAEATYAEYRRQKASGSGSRGFRLPLC